MLSFPRMIAKLCKPTVLERNIVSIRKRLNRIAAAGAAIALTVGLAACGGGNPDDSTDGATDNPYNLITPGQIRVGSVGDTRPYTFTDANGEFTGFDVELFRDVAARIGIDDVEFIGQDFSALLASVANGQFDVGVAAIGITEERQQTVDFSDGYLAGFLTIMAKDTAGLESEDDVAGIRLGVTQGTLQETYAVENFPEAEIVRFPDNNSAVSALNNGTIEAHFLDFESAKLYFDQYDDLVSVADIPSFDAPAGFAVAPGNDALREALNEGLSAAMEDGTWMELHEQFFPGSPMPDMYLPESERTGEPVDEEGDS